jgi:hypothetical protein
VDGQGSEDVGDRRAASPGCIRLPRRYAFARVLISVPIVYFCAMQLFEMRAVFQQSNNTFTVGDPEPLRKKQIQNVIIIV